jgi:toxin CcdB
VVARFDVYANPASSDRASIPYFLDVQSDFLAQMETRVVVPLYLASRFASPVRSLNPELKIGGKSVIMNTVEIGALPTAALRRPIINVASEQFIIQDALDTLFAAY